MLAVQHWYHSYPRNLRRSYYLVLGLSWLSVFGIVAATKMGEIQSARRAARESAEGSIIMPTDTIRYSEMAPPPSLSGEQVIAEAALPEAAAPQAVEDVTSSVPLPVPDEQAEATTMATAKTIAGAAAPAGTGTGAPVFIVPETTKAAYDDNKPAPIIFKYMKATVMPEPLKDVQPEYPEKARALSIEGTSYIDMWLRKDGSVSIVQVYKSSGSPILDSAAARAALKSTFKSARGADGNPVNVWVRRPFKFSLQGGR
jgi:protein TonB